ncbi:metal-dependent hydrolase [Natronomonas sp.]|uniref:metal-dependent hydrolase n=1 Tax=Natronomonas sp. TaxID=2184060 RepID=UPI002FC3B3AD
MAGLALPTLSDVGTLDYAVYLLVAFATHAFVGYVLVATLTDAPPLLGAAVALAPDADFLFPAELGFPFVHRGITHTPAFAAACLLAGYALDADRDVLAAAGLVYGSHLLVDSLTPTGVMWLYPLSEASFNVATGGHSALSTAAIWALFGAIYAGYHHPAVEVPMDRLGN